MKKGIERPLEEILEMVDKKSTGFYVITGLAWATLLLLPVVWAYFQWQECRLLGLSVFYCVQHVL